MITQPAEVLAGLDWGRLELPEEFLLSDFSVPGETVATGAGSSSSA